MFTKAERLISYRNLRLKKKEGFLKVISIFSFLGIMLGVAILIIVMSVMNGFKNDLTKKILGLNPHIVVQPNSFNLDEEFIDRIRTDYKTSIVTKTYSGEGVIVKDGNAKGIIIKGIETNKKDSIKFLTNSVSSGKIENFKKETIFIGGELAFNLNLEVGNKVSLMSSSFISTPFGGLPKQQTFIIAGIFNTGFYEFDQNFIFLNIDDSLSLFDKDKKDQNIEIFLSDPMKSDEIKKKNSRFKF